MRKIGFRFYDRLSEGFWYYWDLSAIPADLPDSIVWQEFTGLQDSNGKDIYEGDVVKLSLKAFRYERDAVVEYKAPQWVLRYRGDFMPLSEWHNYPDRVIAVVGNIYQNQEVENAERI